jgi:hypothetical protein
LGVPAYEHHCEHRETIFAVGLYAAIFVATRVFWGTDEANTGNKGFSLLSLTQTIGGCLDKLRRSLFVNHLFNIFYVPES